MFLAITESKKIVSGEGDDPQINFEKHKIFLYREDFEKFTGGLLEAIQYIVDQQGAAAPRIQREESERNEEKGTENENSINIDIDF